MTAYNTTINVRYRERYNTALCRTRVLIDQTYGIIKRRLPLWAVGLQTDPEDACQYVVACVHGSALCWHAATGHCYTQPWWPDNSRTGHPGDCRSSQQQRLPLQKVHCRAVFRSLNYSCQNIYQWQIRHNKLGLFSFTCIFRIERSLFLPWIYFPFDAFVFLSLTLLLLGMHIHTFKILHGSLV